MLSDTLTIFFNFNGTFFLIFFLVNFDTNTSCLLSQNSKIAEKENGSKRNSIAQCSILMKFVTNVKNNIVYKIMKFHFLITLHVAYYPN